MRLNGQYFNRLDIERHAGDMAVAGGIRKVVVDDDSARGLRILEFRTGTGLSFDVMVDRAMDIGSAEYRGRAFGWRSATGFRHPSLHEYADENGLAWLRSFSGLVVTAGLDHTLFTAEVDASQYRYPHRKTVRNGLHGRIANIPARLQGYGESWEGDRLVLWAEGEVRQAAIFGENLRLHRRIESQVGSDEIRLHDTVTNHGFDSTPHMFLYHINLGWPLVDEDTKFVAPIVRTRWCTQSVMEQRISYQRMPKPQPGFVEQVYEHLVAADTAGRVPVAVINERLNFGLLFEWSASEFPCFFEWLYLREGAYSIGLEPSTHHMEGEQAARDDDSMIWLNHGEWRSYRSQFTVLDGEEALSKAVSRIRGLARQPAEDVPVGASSVHVGEKL